MTDKTFMRADEVAEELDVSKAYAYKIIRQLNDELSAKGFITVAGRVSRQYFIVYIIHSKITNDDSACFNIHYMRLAKFRLIRLSVPQNCKRIYCYLSQAHLRRQNGRTRGADGVPHPLRIPSAAAHPVQTRWKKRETPLG